MAKWNPEAEYERPDRSVTDAMILSLERQQVRGWTDWFHRTYPKDIEVVDFRILGWRHYADGEKDRVLEWDLIIRKKGEQSVEHHFVHGEDADLYPGSDPRFPHSDAAVLNHLAGILDMGPGGEMIVVDMAEDFHLDPRLTNALLIKGE